MPERHRIGCSYWNSVTGPTITCDCGVWAYEREQACVERGGHFWNPRLGSNVCGDCGHRYDPAVDVLPDDSKRGS
jgi:hypothetical protein